jgi:ABC-2 type transport system ATP-binding protein
VPSAFWGRTLADALTLSDVRAGYGGEDVLRGVNLILERGQVHGLVGLNGSGKTSLLDTIAGLIAPSAGTISLGEATLRREDVAYLSTELHFYPRLTGREYLRVFCASRPRMKASVDVDGWANVFGVPLDATIDEYSAGMRRKLALIAIVTMQRPVLLLDEPANTLDIESNALLWDLLRGVAEEGAIVLITSHILDSLAACDRVHRLAEGVIAGSYAPDEFPQLVEHLMTHDLRERRAALGTLARDMGRRAGYSP